MTRLVNLVFKLVMTVLYCPIWWITVVMTLIMWDSYYIKKSTKIFYHIWKFKKELK
jgi:hypothetical protein